MNKDIIEMINDVMDECKGLVTRRVLAILEGIENEYKDGTEMEKLKEACSQYEGEGKILTLKELKDMKPDTIFAEGTIEDSPEGIHMVGSGLELRWVAVRGQIWDWTIYTYAKESTPEWVRDHGDKVIMEEYIRKLVPCDDEAFKMYRY